jgi:hypothetical protein
MEEQECFGGDKDVLGGAKDFLAIAQDFLDDAKEFLGLLAKPWIDLVTSRNALATQRVSLSFGGARDFLGDAKRDLATPS